MEFLFTDKGAGIEALIMILCLGVIALFFAHKGYLFLKRFSSVFMNTKRTPVGLISSSSENTESKTETLESQIQEPITDTTIEAPVQEVSQDEVIESHIQGEDIEAGTVNEEEIYAEYVALVDETHAEKEKLIEEENTEENTKDLSNEIDTEENITPDSTITCEAITETISDSTEQTDSFPENYFDTITGDAPEDREDELPTESSTPEMQNIELHDEEQEENIVDVTENIQDIQEDLVDIEERQDKEAEPDIQEDLHEQEEATGDTTPQEIEIETETPEISQAEIESNSNQEGVHEEQQETIASWEKPTIPAATTEQSNQPQKNHSETIFGLINTIRTVMARGQLIEARALIIQGLALDKNHRELNLMLGSLYEGERHFEKAEYVYKDLAIDHPDDIEILEKLGNVLIIEKRYSIALEIYKKILSLGGETEGTLYILAHLCHEMNDANEGYQYMKKYLKSWPNNPEILALMSEAEIELNKRKDAIETLKRLKNLTPYNGEITATLQKLMMEEELAGNFGNNN